MTATSNRSPHARPSRGGVAFAVFFAAVIAMNALLARNGEWLGAGAAPEWPVMVDLLVFVPMVWLALNWRRGKSAALEALALVGVGALAGSAIVPAESKAAWLVIEDLRFVAIAVVVLFQLGVLTLLLVRVARTRHTRNLELSLGQAIGERFGDGRFARLLRFESRVWLYGLFRRPIAHAFPGQRHFHVGRQGMNAANQQAFLVLIGAELPIAHGLIHLFSPMAAVVVTALSAYGFLFMLAEYRATLHRPISLGDRGLQVRYGVASDFEISHSAIVAVGPSRGPVRRAKGRLRLVGMGEANVVIELAPGTRVAGLFGEAAVRHVYLGVDEPAEFIAELLARLPDPVPAARAATAPGQGDSHGASH